MVPSRADQGDGVGPGVEDGAEARFALRELPVGLRQPVHVLLELADPGGRGGVGWLRLPDVIAGGHRRPGLRARHRTRSLGVAGRGSCRTTALGLRAWRPAARGRGSTVKPSKPPAVSAGASEVQHGPVP